MREMDNLRLIIGPCPSEMTDEELRAKLSLERTRVREALESFRATPPSKGKRIKPGAVTQARLRKELLAAGVTLEEFQQILKEQEDDES
ncbi:MAG: hypothetical protein NWE76_10730 [Candidatus Bathyarchaeota archaeon]|nr:hypothetical protein [Candidatus Bathyarchaeota archaeon]